MFRKFKSNKDGVSWLIALVMVLSFVTPFNVSAAEKTS